LTDLNLANVPDMQRAMVKIHTLACWGHMATHVKGFALEFPDKKTAWYTNNGTNGHGSLKFPLVHANYLVTVQSTLGGNFSIVASTQANLIPVPGQNSEIQVKQISQNAIEVKWVAADASTPVKYELYYNLFQNHDRMQNVSTARRIVCQERGTTMGPCADERAIMNTPCGCRRNGILATTITPSRTGEEGGSIGEGEVGKNGEGDKKNNYKNAGASVALSPSSSNAAASGAASGATGNGNGPKSIVPVVYTAVIDNLPLGVPIFVNVLVIPLNEQYEIAYLGRSISLSFDRVVSAFDETMTHVYIAASVYGIVGILFVVASIQRSRIHRVVNRKKEMMMMYPKTVSEMRTDEDDEGGGVAVHEERGEDGDDGS